MTTLYPGFDENFFRESLDGVILNNVALVHGLSRPELDRRLTRGPGESERDWLARCCAGIHDNYWPEPVYVEIPEQAANAAQWLTEITGERIDKELILDGQDALAVDTDTVSLALPRCTLTLSVKDGADLHVVAETDAAFFYWPSCSRVEREHMPPKSAPTTPKASVNIIQAAAEADAKAAKAARSPFYSWLVRQKDRDDPIGDLAADVPRDKTFPIGEMNLHLLKRHLLHRQAIPEAIVALEEAWHEFKATPMPASHIPPAPSPTKNTARVELLCGDTIEPEAVTWIWSGFLVAHKLNILAGAPSTGKTTLALSVSAAITTGGPLPDGTLAPLGDVLIWSGEDGKGDTLVPRLLACGADVSRVHFVGRVRDGNEMRAFNPANDLPELRAAMLESGRTFQLLIVDSVVSAVSGDSHKNAEVRRGLEPLGALAEETGCAILGISHFTKGTQGRDPIERVTGSLAFGAYARLVLATAIRDKEHGGGRIFTRAKSNLGPDGGGFVYDLEQVALPSHPDIVASWVRWGEPLEGTARQILANAEAQSDDGEGGTLDDAKGWLTGMLQDGPKPAKRIHAEGREAGHSERTIRRAKKALCVEAVKSGMNGGWVWQLP